MITMVMATEMVMIMMIVNDYNDYIDGQDDDDDDDTKGNKQSSNSIQEAVQSLECRAEFGDQWNLQLHAL